jgi:hypothetical protein
MATDHRDAQPPQAPPTRRSGRLSRRRALATAAPAETHTPQSSFPTTAPSADLRDSLASKQQLGWRLARLLAGAVAARQMRNRLVEAGGEQTEIIGEGHRGELGDARAEGVDRLHRRGVPKTAERSQGAVHAKE